MSPRRAARRAAGAAWIGEPGTPHRARVRVFAPQRTKHRSFQGPSGTETFQASGSGRGAGRRPMQISGGEG